MILSFPDNVLSGTTTLRFRTVPINSVQSVVSGRLAIYRSERPIGNIYKTYYNMYCYHIHVFTGSHAVFKLRESQEVEGVASDRCYFIPVNDTTRIDSTDVIQ